MQKHFDSLPLGFENSIEDARTYIGPIFDRIKENAGELAIIRSIETGSLTARTLFPGDNRSVLSETESSFDSEGAILDYYGVDVMTLRSIVQRQSGLPNAKKDNQIFLDNEIVSRDLDATYISSYLLDSYQRACQLNAKDSEVKIRVIDFGGGWGAAFYYTSSVHLPFIDSWCVVDLPQVARAGQSLLEKYSENKWVMYEELSDKLHFCTSVQEAADMPKKHSNCVDVYIMNGVYMHLESPYEIIQQIAQMKPSSLLIGNNFEMGHNMYNYSSNLGIMEMIVGGKSGSMIHKFAVDHPHNIRNNVFEATRQRGAKIELLRVRKRDTMNLKLYHTPDWQTYFIDSEYNRNYHFHFTTD